MKPTARLSAMSVVAGAIGAGAGRLIHFTWPQALVFSLSLVLFSFWLKIRLRPSETPLIEVPAVSLGLTALFALALYVAFIMYPMGAMGSMAGMSVCAESLVCPRFLSMIVVSLPVVPYASFGFTRLATG